MPSTRATLTRGLVLALVLALVSAAGLVWVPRLAPDVAGEVDPSRATSRDRELLVVPLDNPITPPLRLLWRLPDQSRDGRAEVVLETADGVALGPADSVHDDIAALGGGRFSIWKGTAYVSVPAGQEGEVLRWKGRGVEWPWIRPAATALAVVAFLLACRSFAGSAAWRRTLARVLRQALSQATRSLTLPLVLALVSLAFSSSLKLFAPSVSGEIDLGGAIQTDRELRVVPLNNPMSALERLLWRLPDQAKDGKAGVSVQTDDGFALGPPDVMHEEIAALGAGRFSIWNDTVYISVPADHAGKALRWEGAGVKQAWTTGAAFGLWLLAAGLGWWVLEPPAWRAFRRDAVLRLRSSRGLA